MRTPRLTVDSPRPIRRLPAIFAIGVVAALVLPTMATLAAVQNPVAAPSVTASAVAKCTRTVHGFAAANVEDARNRAGRKGIVCFPKGTYTGSLHATVAGQTWRLAAGAKLTGPVYITAPKTKLVGGSIVRPTGDRWSASVEIRANDVTVQAVVFRGGGVGIGVYGKDRSRIVSNAFRSQSGSAISIWSEGVGADNTLITRNSIIQSATHQVSPIMSRGNETSNHGGVQNRGTVITYNKIDQGQGDLGWFGIELKQSKGTVVEHNTIKGGMVLVSLPETDGARIRFNTLDLRGRPFWAIEVANAHDAIVDRNTFIGDGPNGVDYAISINSGSLRTLARHNVAKSIRTFVGIAGDGHRFTDNCTTNVLHFEEFRQNGGANIVFARNKRC